MPIVTTAPPTVNLCPPVVSAQITPAPGTGGPPPGKVAKTYYREVPYTVHVPQMRTRTETYSVTVPYTETVMQSYQVMTPNGMETRTREVNVTRSRRETRTREVPYTVYVPEERTRMVPYTVFEDIAVAASSAVATAIGYQGATGINIEKLRDVMLRIVSATMSGNANLKEISTTTVAVTIRRESQDYTVTGTITGTDRMNVDVKVESPSVPTNQLNSWAQRISSALQPQAQPQRAGASRQSASLYENPRIWTHADENRTVLATLVKSLGPDAVVLKRETDQKLFTVLKSHLSGEDRRTLNLRASSSLALTFKAP